MRQVGEREEHKMAAHRAARREEDADEGDVDKPKATTTATKKVLLAL